MPTINKKCFHCNNGYLVEDVCSKSGTMYYYCGCCFKYNIDFDIQPEKKSADQLYPDLELEYYYKKIFGSGIDDY